MGYCRSNLVALMLVGCMAALVVPAVLAAPMVASAATASAAAMSTAAGAQLNINLQLEGDSAASSLQLQRRDVWRSGAQIVVHGNAGETRQAPPPTRWFVGSLAGAPGSTALLGVHPDGRMTGTVSRGRTSWALSSAPAGPTTAAAGGRGLMARKVVPSAAPTTAATKPKPRRWCGKHGHVHPPGRNSTAPTLAATLVKPVTTQLQATITIDTDFEFYNFFGNVQDTADYIALLVAYLDVVYSTELGVNIRLGQVEVRTNRTAAGYPAGFINTRNSELGVNAVKAWWDANRPNVPRAATIALSGQQNVNWVGYAWDEVLCDWYKAKEENNPKGNWAYGYLSYMQNDFRWNGINNPASVTRDVYNFAHELGHIFGSPHTHEFCNILGNPNTVDDCERSEGYVYLGKDKPQCPQPNGWYKLPNCTAKPTAFGGGPGTIMASWEWGRGYCDERPGDMANIAMTFGLNHPCGNEPDRVVRVIKQHVAVRNAAYPQCFEAGWTKSSKLPMFCNDTATPQTAKGKRLASRGVKVFRWRSGPSASGRLTVHSCGLVTKGTPAVSIRSTPISDNPLLGPWTCEGAATTGCGSGKPGFRLSIQLRPSTVYDIIVVSQGTVAPVLKLAVSAQGSTLAAWPKPSGSWMNPHYISSLPYTSGQFNQITYDNIVPARCTDLVLRSRDAITKYTGPARVFRMWMGPTATGKLTISSCNNTRTADNPNVSVRSTTNRLAPLNGPWQCVGVNDNGCSPTTNKGFRLTIPVAKNTWYYIIVSHTNSVGSPLLKLTVTKS
ncbi:hypothetical protein COHA_007255 [Chlorella ohadii]|uniref:Uncharacterized protein n=1 Tax=Chlorella ohadii TaxID=2649997 RepID=A0AAD5H028_9CHLO|nr:hypothetical protein COHA_007255 [Chlorella ohadii]